jgi:dTDP-4-dehydrorhamnose 3,5-epimerase-like enzyme
VTSAGSLLVGWNARDYRHSVRTDVQGNHSGLHYQSCRPQVKPVTGWVFDVAVDVHKSSRTFGRWVRGELSADNHRQPWVALGFLVLPDSADFLRQARFIRSADNDCKLPLR